ncbi:MFS transporter [Thalassobius sp. Cn5-15]|uniref:MFS transporter n=1 Tax=Thalassobius sp. Cn5-15 TaxID=2917763 RepID=UPI001EF33053|nr:MFS transporter [Thalassobius sp. Cn5-15]MCG7492719.1 MFS transporter [Thalassobius sp. Cn5-15]
MRLQPVPLLTLAIGIIGANSMVLPPIAAAVANDLNARPEQIIIAMSAYGAATALSALFLAPRADVIGADRSLRRACALLTLALVLTALAPTVTLLQGAHLLAGLGAGMGLPAIYGLAAEVAPKGQEKRTLGKVLAGWTLSLVGGVLLASVVADLVGWRWLYALLAGLTALLWLLLGRTQINAACGGTPTSPLSAMRVAGVGRALFSNAMLMLGFFGLYGFLGIHVAEGLGRSTTSAGVLTMFYGSGYGIGSLLLPKLMQGSRETALTLGFGGLTLAHGIIGGLSGTYQMLLVGAGIWGVFQAMTHNAVLDRLNTLDPRQRGAIMGLNSASTYACVMLGGVLYALPYNSYGLMGCAALSVACNMMGNAEALLPRRQATSDQISGSAD